MIASMWIGNLMLVVINLPLIGIWVQLLKVPYRFLYLAILLFCAIGVYTVNNSYSAVIIAAFFGVVGFVLMRLECEPAPMILGFVLGPADGGEPPPRDEDFRRRSDDLPQPADQPGTADRRGAAAGDPRAAVHPRQARGGFQDGMCRRDGRGAKFPERVRAWQPVPPNVRDSVHLPLHRIRTEPLWRHLFQHAPFVSTAKAAVMIAAIAATTLNHRNTEDMPPAIMEPTAIGPIIEASAAMPWRCRRRARASASDKAPACRDRRRC